jgi:hypothetical protein
MSAMSHDAEPFGFFVEPRLTEDGTEGWEVGLPHQCDSWMIVGDGYNKFATHDEAVAELERFITEATAALDTLKAAGGRVRPPWWE